MSLEIIGGAMYKGSVLGAPSAGREHARCWEGRGKEEL